MCTDADTHQWHPRTHNNPYLYCTYKYKYRCAHQKPRHARWLKRSIKTSPWDNLLSCTHTPRNQRVSSFCPLLLSWQRTHCNLSFSQCHYRLPSEFKASCLYLELVVISCLFCTQTKGSTAGEVRKRPLAAQTDDDSFTTPDWNTTINCGTLHVKREYRTCLVSDETADPATQANNRT